LLFSNGLESISVIKGELRKVDHLGVNIDAWINETNSVDVQFNDRTGDTAISDAIVLLLKVIGVYGTIVSLVRLAPDAEAVAT
jgi:hypothetical protein